MADKTQDKSAVNDKERNLQLALAKIEKDFGKGAIMRLGETEIPKVEAISTGRLTSHSASAVFRREESLKFTDRNLPVKLQLRFTAWRKCKKRAARRHS